MLSSWVHISYSPSFVALFHEGSGQLLVFRDDAIPLLQLMEQSKRTDGIDPSLVSEVVSSLRKFNMIDE